MGQGHKDISSKHILKAVDASLKRLQSEQIDLYFTHWDDDKTPVEETLGAYQKLIDAGKIKYIGASNLSPIRLKESLQAAEKQHLPRYQVFQPGYNLYDREDFEQELASLCKKEGLGVITYFSLASGFLTGKYRNESDLDKSVRGGGVKKYLNTRGSNILAALDKLANKHSVSPAGVALAWLINKEGITAPIASATKKQHFAAFIQAASLKLDKEDMHHLDKASSY